MHLTLLGHKVIVLDFDVELADMFHNLRVWDWEVEVDGGKPISRGDMLDDEDATPGLAAAIDTACVEEEQARAEDRHANKNYFYPYNG